MALALLSVALVAVYSLVSALLLAVVNETTVNSTFSSLLVAVVELTATAYSILAVEESKKVAHREGNEIVEVTSFEEANK